MSDYLTPAAKELMEEMRVMESRETTERKLRRDHPAVRDAWEKYKTVLALAMNENVKS